MESGQARRAAPAQPGRSTAIERTALIIFYVFTAMSVVGYAVFGLHPELLAQTPSAIKVYSVAFTFFPRAHVLLGFATLALVLVRRTGVRWVPAFAACYLLSLASELAGTTVGLPFGPYHYTAGLGTKWFGHVPVLIPLSWFFMALPSYLLARAALAREARGQRAGRVITIAVGSLVLLAWDLALDPAMSWITKYWVWGKEGPYYGMPLLNLFGWYVTGIALMSALLLAGVVGAVLCVRPSPRAAPIAALLALSGPRHGGACDRIEALLDEMRTMPWRSPSVPGTLLSLTVTDAGPSPEIDAAAGLRASVVS